MNVQGADRNGKASPDSSRKTAPIFIVGVPRSGTTLLASLIGSHSEIACGPESHFFTKLRRSERKRAIQDPRWPERAVELLSSLSLVGGPIVEYFGLTRGDIHDYLLTRSPSEQAMLESSESVVAVYRLTFPRPGRLVRVGCLIKACWKLAAHRMSGVSIYLCR